MWLLELPGEVRLLKSSLGCTYRIILGIMFANVYHHKDGIKPLKDFRMKSYGEQCLLPAS